MFEMLSWISIMFKRLSWSKKLVMFWQLCCPGYRSWFRCCPGARCSWCFDNFVVLEKHYVYDDVVLDQDGWNVALSSIVLFDCDRFWEKCCTGGVTGWRFDIMDEIVSAWAKFDLLWKYRRWPIQAKAADDHGEGLKQLSDCDMTMIMMTMAKFWEGSDSLMIIWCRFNDGGDNDHEDHCRCLRWGYILPWFLDPCVLLVVVDWPTQLICTWIFICCVPWQS